MREKVGACDQFGATVRRGAGTDEPVQVRGHYEVVCRDAQGNERWRDTIDNLVTDNGLDDLLISTLTGGTRYTTWYVGLKHSGAPANGDTPASHAAWTEAAPYSNGTRPACTFGTVSGASVSNSASKAVFNINATDTDVAGAFLCNDSTKSGTTGRFYSVGNFSGGVKSVGGGDTLEVTATFSTQRPA